MEHRLLFWWRWLVVATIAVIVFGLSLVVLPGPTQQAFNVLYFSSPQGSAVFGEAAVAYVTFISAVLGSVLFGWAVLMLYVLFGPFRRGSKEGWRMIAVSLVAWFIPDTAFSLWSGFWQNAVLNLVLGVIFVIPLAATYRVFQTERIE